MGTLRTADGALLVHKHIPPQPALLSQGFGGGQADFHEQNTAGGILLPQLNVPAASHVFHIFETHETAVDAPALPALEGWASRLLSCALLLGASRRLRRRGPDGGDPGVQQPR